MASDASKIPTITGDLAHHHRSAGAASGAGPGVSSRSHVRVETNLQKIVFMQRPHTAEANRPKATHRSAASALFGFLPSAVSLARRDRPSRPPRFNLLGKPIDEKLLKNRRRLAYIRKVQFLTHNFLERPDSKSAISYHILQ